MRYFVECDTLRKYTQYVQKLGLCSSFFRLRRRIQSFCDFHYIIINLMFQGKKREYSDKISPSVRYNMIEVDAAMYENEFARRLSQLRTNRGVSARDMSLSLGQNHGYINTIENGKAYPTMVNFFAICDFLHVSPQEFFDAGTRNPEKIRILTEMLKQLDERQIDSITAIVEGLLHKGTK